MKELEEAKPEVAEAASSSRFSYINYGSAADGADPCGSVILFTVNLPAGSFKG